MFKNPPHGMKFAMFKRLTSPLPYVWPIVYEQMLFITLRCHFDEEIVKKKTRETTFQQHASQVFLKQACQRRDSKQGKQPVCSLFYVVSTSSRILWHRRVMKSTITLVSLDYSRLVLLVSILLWGKISQDCSGLCCWIWLHIADIYAVPPSKIS